MTTACPKSSRSPADCANAGAPVPAPFRPPHEVNALIRCVPKDRLATINLLRAAITQAHGATVGCPITTGLFTGIAAHAAAAEDAANGRKRVTPWWRMLKEGDKLNPKFPGGIAEQAKRLRAEGNEILPGKGGQPPKVAGYKTPLARLTTARPDGVSICTAVRRAHLLPGGPG